MTRAFTTRAALFASRPLLAFRGHRRRAAAGATAASAVLGRRRQRALDPPRRGARLQPDPRSICQRANARRAHRHLQGRAQRRAACALIRRKSSWRGSSMSPTTKPTKQAALTRQAAYTKRTVDVSRKPDGKGGSQTGRNAAHMFSPTPTKPAAPRRMRFTARRTRSPRCSRICSGQGCTMSSWSSPAASRNCAVSRARSCRPLPRSAPAADAAE